MIGGTINRAAELKVGTRVRSAIGARYGRGDGIVCAVHGASDPASVGALGGVVSYGGRCTVDVAFPGHTVTPHVPESIVRGPGWEILDAAPADADEVIDAVLTARAAMADKAAAEKAAAERRAAERAKHAADNPHLLTKAAKPNWSPARLAAANIRTELKAAFPKVKFSVTADGYNTVNVRWANGPTTAAVEATTAKYKAGSFDGMEDIYRPDPDATFADVFGDPNYVFTSRDSTVEALRAAWEKAGFDPAEVTDKWYDTAIARDVRETWSKTAF